MPNQLQILKDLRNKLPESYITELAKVSNPKKAAELARIFFTYQSIYDADPKHENKLSECSVSSIMTCLVVCAKTGLWPDPVTNYIYFIPYGGKAKPQISYHGLTKLICETGEVTAVKGEVIREGEKFDLNTFEHERSLETLDNPVVAAYATCKLNGEIMRCIIGKKELAKIQSCAPMKKVWEAWPGPMKRKAVLRRLINQVRPQLTKVSSKLNAAIEQENSDYDLGRTIEQEETAGSPDQLMELLEEKEE